MFMKRNRRCSRGRRRNNEQASATWFSVECGSVTAREIGRVEDQRCLSGGFTAGKAGGEEARMRSRRNGRREETREESMVGRIGEARGRVACFPAGWGQIACEGGKASLPEKLLRHIIAQRIECDKQKIMRA